MTLVLDIGDQSGTISVPENLFHAGAYYDLIAVAGSAFSAPGLMIEEKQSAAAAYRRPAGAGDSASAAKPPGDPEDTISTKAMQRGHARETPNAAAERATGAGHVESGFGRSGERGQARAEMEADARDRESVEASRPRSVAVSPFGVVNVNPDAGLHLRQYPTSDAMSLAMLPAASEVIVLGTARTFGL